MKASIKRAFITGAGGFIEANFVYYFLKKNYELHILLKKDANYWICYSLKIKNLLGWSSKYDINEGPAKTAFWLKQHHNY